MSGAELFAIVALASGPGLLLGAAIEGWWHKRRAAKQWAEMERESRAKQVN